MSTQLSPSPVDERDRYPIHEEENVPEIDVHERQVRYCRDALETCSPDCYVGGNLCIYWERGNTRRYIAPDVFVAAGRLAKPKPRVYLLWEDPPVRFVLEVISRETQRVVEKNRGIYRRHLKAVEVLEVDAERHGVTLWRLGPAGYVAAAVEPNGRLRSEELGLEFALDAEDFLWIYTLGGERLLTHEEEHRRRTEAEAKAAEAARAREVAEARAGEAEARAEEETRRREELEQQLARLQARLKERDS